MDVNELADKLDKFDDLKREYNGKLPAGAAAERKKYYDAWKSKRNKNKPKKPKK